LTTQPAPETGGPSWLGLTLGLVRRQWLSEWHGSPLHLMGLSGRRAEGPAAEPHDLRPCDSARGAEILDGQWRFAGEVMGVGHGGDPWDRPSPSRPFAESLHRMEWLGDLLCAGEAGEREALRLLLEWRRIFGRWNSFAWDGAILERRVFNLACALKRVCTRASDAETALLAETLGRQARHLLGLARHHGRTAEHAAAAALAGLALGGEAGLKLAERAGAQLDAALIRTVLPDGGHASRSPQAGLELLFDLLTLDEAFSQRGRPPPEEVSRASDRLAAALRLLTLPDGRLPCFQGGEAGSAADVAAARAATDLPEVPSQPAMGLPHAGYQRLAGRKLTVVADIAAPAHGEFAETACAQTLAIEVFDGAERLITNAGWSTLARAAQALRMTSAGSTVSIGEASAGAPLTGWAARALGPRLADAAIRVETRLHQAENGLWLDLSHDGWLGDFGLRHERLIYLDLTLDELRGEDRLLPIPGGRRPRMLPMTVRFHLAPLVRASLARDGKSVLIQGQASPGWWLRNDAGDVAIEASVHFEDGEPKRTTQVVLRSQIASDVGGRVRWKLAPIKPQP
jgi:uncharacterized heparinase superfamily protein